VPIVTDAGVPAPQRNAYRAPLEVIQHADRFWAQVRRDWNTCALWHGAVRRNGLAYFIYAKRTVTVWEFAWLTVCDLPTGRLVIRPRIECHPLCVDVAHIRARRPNHQGRAPGRRQLPTDPETRNLIRRLYRGPFEHGRAKMTAPAIAASFKISLREVREILDRDEAANLTELAIRDLVEGRNYPRSVDQLADMFEVDPNTITQIVCDDG
jgi:hypothetical protein